MSKRDLIFQHVFNKSQEGFLLLEKERIIECNPAAASLLGYESTDDLLGKALWEASSTPQEDGVKAKDKIRTHTDLCLKDGYCRFEWQHSANQADKVYFDIVLTAIDLEDKQFIHCALREINEYKKIHFDLKEREEMFHIAFEDAPVGMSIISSQGFRFITVNPKMCTMLGYTKEDFKNETLKLITHPDDEDRSNEWIRKKFNNEPCEPLFEKRYIHKEGHIVWGLVSSEWVKNEDGSNRMAITHILDITEMKMAEQELIKHRDHLEKLVAERTKQLQIKNEEVTSQNEEITCQNEELFHQRKLLEEQNSVIDRSNKELIVYKNQLEEIVQHRTHELHEANITLDRKNQQLEQFAFMAAHNLRSPVASILGLSNLLENDKIADSHLEIVSLINKSVKKLDLVVKSLTSILSDPTMVLKLFENCDFANLLEETKGILEEEISAKNAYILADFRDCPQISSVKAYMHNLFYNMLSNALKYSKPLGVVKIEITSKKVGSNVQITFQDSGLGINMEKHQHEIFAPFKRFASKTEGAGVGLYLVQTQINTLGGSIFLDSKLGEGTTFIVTLPNAFMS